MKASSTTTFVVTERRVVDCKIQSVASRDVDYRAAKCVACDNEEEDHSNEEQTTEDRRARQRR